VKTLVIDVDGLDEKTIEILRNLISVLKKRKVNEEDRKKAFLSAAGGWKNLVPEDLASQLIQERHSAKRKEVVL
jgi:hypothetical protein